MKKSAALAASIILVAGVTLADTPKEKHADSKSAPSGAPSTSGATGKDTKPTPALSEQVEELRRALEAQQAQIELLKEELAKRDKKDGEEHAQSPSTNGWTPGSGTGAPFAGTNGAGEPNSAELAHAAVVSNNDREAVDPASPQKTDLTSPENVSPLQLKVGSAYITPVGFMDFTGVWRSRNGGSGIGTNFGGIPYGAANSFQTNLSEFRFSMQNSRIGFRVDALVHGAHVIGYMESDFLGNNPTNVAVTSNSNTLRSRLYWVDVRKSAWEVLGGQSWSLATPNRVGVSPLPADVFFSYNMDVNYQAGMIWGRIPELRVAYHFPHDKAAFALALDSPEQYAGGTNGIAAATYPAALTPFYPGGELNNGNTTLGVPNRAPDVIAKFVVDPSSRLHFEVGGIARFFQLYNPLTAQHFSATGGAGFANLDFGLFKGLRFLTHNYWSDGGGRYIFGSAPDLIARADGSPSLVHSGSTTNGFEYSHHNTTLFTYWGLIYVGRDATTDTTGKLIGWGYTGSPSGQNRTVQEPTFGFIQNFWKDPKYGTLSLIGQYSYVNRDPWYIAVGQPKNAHVGMAFIDLRYTLPGSAPTLGAPGKE